MSNVIHETILKDIVDIIDDTKDILDDDSKKIFNKSKKDNFKSLVKNTNDLILVFPVLCTKGISIDTASMITKAIEKKCVTLLQLLLASIQISDVEDLQGYIAKFHSNISIGNKITVDDFLTFMDRIDEGVSEGYFKIIDNEAYNTFKQNLSQINNIADLGINENCLADIKCHRHGRTIETVLESKKNKSKSKSQDTVKTYDQKKSKSQDTVKAYSQKKTIHNHYEVSSKSRDAAANRQFVEYLAANDIKKANELMPTKVIVNFKSKDPDNGTVVDVTNAIIGVKCKLYVVDSMEIIERIATKYADANWVRELVRASTGEISFWRDFVFALDRAKLDAINTSKKGSTAQMFKVLERRATKYKLGKWKKNRADSSPITTLVVNQDELEYLKKEYDINLENRKIALKLMESYNFMGLVVVDEPSEFASFIWDAGNDAAYETLSFRNLERESNDRDYRKVINLLTAQR